ncbi:hypothetical protein [Roseovarius sp. THAF8]|uniref:hypothetical protein n=1 Tax=Roseovarius sp. THAF8 TaxID=2587846 RepID=UPI001562683D|nr:hypothetical protein [Roseovarius sp. THAF8]
MSEIGAHLFGGKYIMRNIFCVVTAGFLCFSSYASSEETGAEWRYYTYESKKNLSAEDIAKGYPVCVSGDWSPENSGHPDHAAGWLVRRHGPITTQQSVINVFQATASGLCDLAAVAWHETDLRDFALNEVNKWGFVEIVGLRTTDP